MERTTGTFNFFLPSLLVIALVCTFLFFTSSCKDSGKPPTPAEPAVIEGRVVSQRQPAPVMKGLKVSAISGGEATKTAKVNPRTGEYSIELEEAGGYDLRLRTPTGVLDFNYNVQASSGKTTKAPDIELPVGALAPPSTVEGPSAEVSAATVATGEMKPPAGVEMEAASVVGTVYPDDAEVKLLDGKEVIAQVQAAAGKFKFPEVNPGLYDMEFSAPGYAENAIKNVAVSSEGATKSLNGFLLYRSPLDGVDYEKGLVTETGLGKPNPDMPSGQASTMACRAARNVAYRDLLDTILSLEVAKDKSVRDIDTSGKITTRLRGFVRGAKLIKRKKHDDGSCEVTLQIPLYGSSGVTGFLQEITEK